MHKFNFQLLLCGVLGGSGVALGAFGAHGLRPRLEEAGMLEAWETAVLYHLVHAAALLGIALVNGGAGSLGRAAFWAATLWICGVFLFSGSLYLLAIGGPAAFLGPVTPAGGVLLIAGWAAIVCESVRWNSRKN